MGAARQSVFMELVDARRLEGGRGRVGIVVVVVGRRRCHRLVVVAEAYAAIFFRRGWRRDVVLLRVLDLVVGELRLLAWRRERGRRRLGEAEVHGPWRQSIDERFHAISEVQYATLSQFILFIFC